MKYLLLILVAGLALIVQPVWAGEPVVPGAGFPASRYEALWTKSPFAVATSEATTESSPDYSVGGISNIAGISYASVIDAHNGEHFLISSDRPTRGLTLSSITIGRDGADTHVIVQKDGQLITLKLEQPTATAQPVPGAPPVIMPPGMGVTFPNSAPASTRIFTPRIHRPPVLLPPRTDQQGQPSPPPAPAPIPAPQK
jgi:hypothetical protein